MEGKVAVITGAGAGLGRAYALELAKLGASVVVNDWGGEGSSASIKAADKVVAEIRQLKRGDAVADYNNAVDGAAVIQTALNSFGRVDILINNAGILKDRPFSKLSQQEWDAVYAVHVTATFSCCKAAWPVFLNQRSNACIINICSAAGMYGNYGQSNYSAAKMAIYSLTKTLAKEGESKGIRVIAIAPIADSQMTKSVLPTEILAMLKPESVASFVAYLSSDQCKENGALLEVGGGYAAKARLQRAAGYSLSTKGGINENSFWEIASNANEIFNYTQETCYPTAITEIDWVQLAHRSKAKSPTPIQKQGSPLADKVVLITGAGAGLGKSYAKYFALLGATVCLNDLDKRAAEPVVEEIKKSGGKAISVIGSVATDVDEIVSSILLNFGRIDVLVNNAGILRDRSFAKISQVEWETVQTVHAMGTFRMCKAVWPLMLKQKYGRIINTTSAVALYGNFGQSNYSAAKGAIWGLSNSLGVEAKKSQQDICVNCIAPNAGTAMTATILPKEVVDLLLPDYVAPLVAYLGSNLCKFSGTVIEVGSGWQGAVRWERAAGLFIERDKLLAENSLKQIASNWKLAESFNVGATHPSTIYEAMQMIFEKLSSHNTSVDSYTKRDIILYNIGVGCTSADLHYVYEKDPNFSCVPTFGVTFALKVMLSCFDFSAYLENFNPRMLLHGEHAIRFHSPIPIKESTTVLTSFQLVQSTQKLGKASLLRLLAKSFDSNGNRLLFENEAVLMIRGAQVKREVPLEGTIFNKPIDTSNIRWNKIEISVSADLAVIYRLSGDLNPLHVDPVTAKSAGFSKPILHGMCTFGIAARVLGDFYQRAKIVQIQARFSQPVFPGDRLLIRHFPISQSLIAFSILNAGTQQEVVTGGQMQVDSNQARL